MLGLVKYTLCVFCVNLTFDYKMNQLVQELKTVFNVDNVKWVLWWFN